MVGGKQLVRQVVQFKKTYSRYVCLIKIYVLGDRKEIVKYFGGNRKENRKEIMSSIVRESVCLFLALELSYRVSFAEDVEYSIFLIMQPIMQRSSSVSAIGGQEYFDISSVTHCPTVSI